MEICRFSSGCANSDWGRKSESPDEDEQVVAGKNRERRIEDYVVLSPGSGGDRMLAVEAVWIVGCKDS